MRHRDQTSTNPYSPNSKDDRPLVPRQDKHGKWEVIRQGRGEKLIAAGLSSKDEAHTAIERERHLVPHTDSTRQDRTRSQIVFEISDDKWNRIFGGRTG
jgi:hypothetical protein